jgi:spore germination cell wall hydrolase CwlJ-like protein
MTVKITHFLLSLAVAVSSTVAVAEVQQDQVVLADNTTFSGQMVDQASKFVRTTVDRISAPFLSQQDVECLARNIFYEAGAEPIEGKVAVGMVTLNRTQDERYPQNVCGVVRQRTVVTVPQQVTEVRTVKTGLFTPPKQVVEIKTRQVTRTIYQFSWVGQRNIRIREDDPRWVESRAVAEELSRGGYETWQEKYSEAMNFHAVYVNPGWKLKRIGRVGNHIFYKGNVPVQQGG